MGGTDEAEITGTTDATNTTDRTADAADMTDIAGKVPATFRATIPTVAASGHRASGAELDGRGSP